MPVARSTPVLAKLLQLPQPLLPPLLPSAPHFPIAHTWASNSTRVCSSSHTRGYLIAHACTSHSTRAGTA
eukprot:2296719-Rhodomonas_salina.1